MKNSIKLLACAIIAAGGLAQAATPNFTALTFSGTGVAGLTATNPTTGTITYSASKITSINTLILSEFYASDLGTNYVAATGDKLAICNNWVNAVDTTSTIIGYKKLNNGVLQPIYKYTYTTNSLVGNVYLGDVVILNSKGQVKVDLSIAGAIPPDESSYDNWNYVWNYNNIYQNQQAFTFYFTFGGVAESFNFYLTGGGAELYSDGGTYPYNGYEDNWLEIYSYYGSFSYSGGGSVTIANPNSALLNKTVLFTNVSTVESTVTFLWYWD